MCENNCASEPGSETSKHWLTQASVVLLLFALLITLLAGCGKKEDPLVPSPQVIQAQQKADDANRQRDLAVQKATELEKSKKAAEDASQKYQTLAIGLGFAVVVALFIGIGMGSSTRKDAAKAKKAANE